MLTTAERVRTRPSHVIATLWACAWIALGAHLILGAAYGPARPPAPLTRTASAPAPAPPPAVAAVARSIQDMRVGDRVLTRAPERGPGPGTTPGVLPVSEPSVDAEEVDPATWRRVELTMPEGPGGDLEIVLLRPSWWVEAAGARAGGAIALDLPEMGAVGVARVIGVEPCPPLKPGRGRVVTGTYTHSGATVLDVGVEGLGEPVGATPIHPFYSAGRQRYVATKDLAAGERLLTSGGEARVTSVARRPGGHRVYNLEVHGDHVYRVSALGVLVHNTSPAGGGTGPAPVNPPANPGNPFPANAQPGQTLPNIDPNTLQAGRGDLLAGKLVTQQQLIQQGMPRTTPIQVTPAGVIWDGNHGAAAAAQAGVPVIVQVVPQAVTPKGPVTFLPIRP